MTAIEWDEEEARRDLQSVARNIDEEHARRSPNRAFTARWEGVCGQCWDLIEPGQTARYTREGVLVHNKHEFAPSKPAVTCERCWLVVPCDCDS